MKKNKTFPMTIALSLIISFALGACSSNKPSPTPTLSIAAVQTEAVATFASGLTQTAQSLPTATATATSTSTPTETSTPAQPAATSTIILPTGSCYSLAFLSDVSIPDNTEFKPGEKFTKTWRVSNNGSCAWDAGFKLVFTGGNSLGGATFVLTKEVTPGSTTNLSIFMTAPSKDGSYQSNWRMSDEDGAYFGDELYAIIKVVGGTTTATTTGATSTPKPSATTGELPTETPEP